jgi:hypothetical protein
MLAPTYTVNPDCNVILREFSSGKCEWQVASGIGFLTTFNG